MLNIAKGNWNIAKGKLKQWIGRLTRNHSQLVAGKADELVGRIQRRQRPPVTRQRIASELRSPQKMRLDAYFNASLRLDRKNHAGPVSVSHRRVFKDPEKLIAWLQSRKENRAASSGADAEG